MRKFFKNKYVKFAVAAIVYTLLTVVWTGNLWMLLGLPLIYDFYISRLFYKYVWHYNEEFCSRWSWYKSIYGWVDAIVWAVVAASLLHIFVFQLYKVPTSSMEKTILIGDYLYVSKITYGPQVPNTPLSMPFVFNTMPFSTTAKSYSEAIHWDYHRLKGLKSIERNDVVVFNYPAGDSVLMPKRMVPAAALSYYDALRSYEATYGAEQGRVRLNEDYEVIARPVDKRENYIKRCTAIPGDTVELRDGILRVNGKEAYRPQTMQYIYLIETTAPLTNYMLDKFDITEYGGSMPYYYAAMTEESADKLKKVQSVKSVTRYVNREITLDTFPNDAGVAWSCDNFGPLTIPAKGTTITLTMENLPLYRRIIEQYEGHKLEVRDGSVYVNGEVSPTYTFAMDYYWMMGDNRHNSADSRFWGFVPEDHIVGKASFIIFSRGDDGIRWNRLFKKIE